MQFLGRKRCPVNAIFADAPADHNNDITLTSPGISLEGLMLKLKLQYFGHLMRRVDSLEKTLMLGWIEVKHKPNPEITGARQVCLPVMQDLAKDLNINEFFQVGDLSMLGKPGEYLVKMNQDFVSGNEAFVSFLNLAQNPENLPLVNHCTAGKDRTGFGSALLLLLLGVPEKTVMEDYLLSNGFREKLNEKMMAFLGAKLQNDESRAILGAMFEARAEYLQAAIGEIQKQYGSVEAYAEKALGFTKESLEQMKVLLLEDK